jgi:hypothetical protein
MLACLSVPFALLAMAVLLGRLERSLGPPLAAVRPADAPPPEDALHTGFGEIWRSDDDGGLAELAVPARLDALVK